MTPEQEYEEAVEMVAAEIFGNDWSHLTEYDRKYYRGRARTLLSLTWPSGQPVIGVMSQNQEIPPLVHGQMPPVRSLIESGFRRVVCPALKQEAK